jgi:hypothetical protein
MNGVTLTRGASITMESNKLLPDLPCRSLQSTHYPHKAGKQAGRQRQPSESLQGCHLFRQVIYNLIIGLSNRFLLP